MSFRGPVLTSSRVSAEEHAELSHEARFNFDFASNEE